MPLNLWDFAFFVKAKKIKGDLSNSESTELQAYKPKEIDLIRKKKVFYECDIRDNLL